jgi:rare lipoprotein A
MEQFTAAHRTRPFNQWVRVHNLDSGKSVDVRINDRGPFIDGRVIDLSLAAARTVEMVGPGTAWVRVQTVHGPEPSAVTTNRTPAEPPDALSAPGLFAVQAGAFERIDNAERMSEQLNEIYGGSRLAYRDGDPPVWRVIVGEFDTAEEAQFLAGEIQASMGSAFVVRLDEAGLR